ncbi:MAG TPA: DNA cytosine methyltransferase [Ktedonobacteraceae bacterium]|nr:DNA cytosine methyltransferase [Ktedonobacteraceae bacterium]
MAIAIDLFAGAGGLGEGLESAGIRVAAAVELHPQPALTYAFNNPSAKVFAGDIHNLSMDLLAESVSQRTGFEHVDLVVGGPPCQGFSTAGKKVSTDPRNSLFQEFARVVEHFLPKMFLLENVPGFKKMHGGQAYSGALELFEALGYEVCDTVLDASWYGVPQRRQRFVMVGRRRDETERFIWPTPTHGYVEQTRPTLFDEPLSPFTTVYEALEDIAFLEPGWESHRHQVEPLSNYQSSRRHGTQLIFNHLATRHRPKAVVMFSHIREGGTIASVPPHLRSGKKTMARLDRYSVSNAVLAMPDDLVHYRHNRIPTVREMARLQSFDDDYVFFGKRTSGFVERRVDVPQYTQVGNAVPPLLGRALGIALLAALNEPTQDIRDFEQRQHCSQWVRGSSGYAGYTLDAHASREIDLVNVYGEPLTLAISEDDRPVHKADSLVEWTQVANPMRRQWAPDVTPKDLPVYMANAAAQ